MQDIIDECEAQFREGQERLRGRFAAALTRFEETAIAALRTLVEGAQTAQDEMQTAGAEFRAEQSMIVAAAESTIDARRRIFLGQPGLPSETPAEGEASAAETQGEAP